MSDSKKSRFFGRLRSEKSKPKQQHKLGPSQAVTRESNDAISKLRDTEDMLLKKQQFLESKVNKEIEIAKANATKNKRGQINFFNIGCMIDIISNSCITSFEKKK